jgi:hypothetical protein
LAIVTPNSSLRYLLTTLLLVAILLPGCHRGYYRRMADKEAAELVQQKAADPRWESATGNIQVAPESRMFNPFSQDHPPIPPDDATSAELMRRVDGRPGYPHWHANGDTEYVENPEWLQYLPMNEKGEVILDFDRAFDLALLHSTVYQRQREELYLTALDVALERFGFDSQLFAGYNSFLSLRRGESAINSGLGANGGGISFRKLGITGASYTIGLANSILWNFGNSATQSASSLVNFSIVQPLMRGAGRDRIMESLTQAERDLLGNVRLFERFRQGYFLEITVGRAAANSLSRGAGNFLGNPTQATFGVGGVLGLLQTQQNILNQEINVKYLEDVVEQFREFQRRDRVDALQVKQTESRLFSAQSNLLQLKTNYQNDLDRFKIVLGLPPWVPVSVVDDYLAQFRLISLPIQDRQRRVIDLRKAAGDQLNRIDALLPLTREEAADFQWSPDLESEVGELKSFLEKALAEIEEIEAIDQEQIQGDFEKLENVRPERISYLTELRAKVDAGEMLGDVDPAILEDNSVPKPENLRNALTTTLGNLAKVKQNIELLLEKVRNAPAQKAALPPAEYYDYINNQILFPIADQMTQLNNLLIEVSLTQALARSNSITLPQVDLTPTRATEIASCFRLDWMNARAALVDNWRQIEFVADQLESQFDLILDGSMGNDGNNPFKIDYTTGVLRGGFRFDTPIVRFAERNQYRDALIRYQRARRNYYQYEDEVSRNLRLSLRTLDQFKIQFELSRRNVQVAVEQFEIARFRLDQPARAGGGGGGGGGAAIGGGGGGGGANALGSTAARDLLDAITNLQNAQDQYMQVWVRYEVLRRGLDYDLGTMVLDETGRWIDPGLIDSTIDQRAAAQLGIDPTCLDCSLPPSMQAFESMLGPGGGRESSVDESAEMEEELAPKTQPGTILPVPEPSPNSR